MSNTRYLTKLRATMKTQAPHSKGRTKLWSRMFLATAFLAATPLQISAVHSSIRPAQTLWNTDTSSLAPGVFSGKAAEVAAPELVQVADRNGKFGGRSGEDKKGGKGKKGGDVKKGGKYEKKDVKRNQYSYPEKPPYCPPKPDPEPEPKPEPKPTPRNNPCDGADNCGSEMRTKKAKPVVEDNIVSVHG
jgi:outer membrane biosynthesis protein TonB